MGKGTKIRVAIAGCGMIAQKRHIPEYIANRDAEIIGYYDINSQRSQELAHQYGGKAYATFDEILADPNVDAVSICLPNMLHAQCSIAAMRAGKDVLCEKPMAITIEDAAEMVRVSHITDSILMVGHNQRFVQAHCQAKMLIESGIMGRILSINTRFMHAGPESWSIDSGRGTWFFDAKKAQFGVLGDLGAHKIDLIRYLLGEELTDIHTMSVTQHKCYEDGRLIDLEDNAVSVFRTHSGIHGTMNVSWTNYGHEDNSTIVYGEEGVLRIFADPKENLVLQMRNGDQKIYDVEGISTNDNQQTSGVIDAFVEAVRFRCQPQVSGMDGYHTLKCIVAAQESSRTKQWVAIEDMVES